MNNEDLTPRQNPGHQPPKNIKPSNHTIQDNFAVISMAIGIFSILCMCLPPVQLTFGVLAIMFAFLSKKGNTFSNYAKTGLSIGIFSCLTSFYLWINLIGNLNNPQISAMLKEMFESIDQAYESAYQQQH